MQPIIRNARPGDAARLSVLSDVLGYAIDDSEAAQRIDELSAHEDHVIFVAELHGEVIGFAHLAMLPSFISGPFAVLAALVVDPETRRMGVAGTLADAVEDRARGRGFRRLLVRSSASRVEAHAFYVARGYARSREQTLFAKPL